MTKPWWVRMGRSRIPQYTIGGREMRKYHELSPEEQEKAQQKAFEVVKGRVRVMVGVKEGKMKKEWRPSPECLELKRDWDMLRPYLYLLRKKQPNPHRKEVRREMVCKHNLVDVWTLEEIHQIYDLERKEWDSDRSLGDIKKVELAVCRDCEEDLSEEVAADLDLL